MALAIQKSRTPSVKGRLLSTLIMAFALMLQPMYGVVAGKAANAAPYVSPSHFGFESLTNWQTDRAAPSGDYARSNTNLVLNVDGDSPDPRAAGDAFRRTEGIKADLPAGTNSIKATLYVDPAWEDTIGVRAGIWGVTSDPSPYYPILEFSNRNDADEQVAGNPVIRAWDSYSGWVNLVTSPSYGSSYVFEIVHDPIAQNLKYYLNDNSTPAYTAAATANSLTQVIFNSYNPGIADNDYSVSWTNFEAGVKLPEPEIHSVRFNTMSTDEGSTYDGVVIDSYMRNFSDVTSVKVEIERADGSKVFRRGNHLTRNHIGQGGNRALTTPFSFDGDTGNPWWSPQQGVTEWTKATKPVRVTIVVNTANQGKVTFSTPIGQELVEKNGAYGSLINPSTPTGLHRTVKGSGEILPCGATSIRRVLYPTWDTYVDNEEIDYFNYETSKGYATTVSGNSFNTHNSTPSADGANAFRVQAVDIYGNESEWSSWCDVTYDSTAPSLISVTSDGVDVEGRTLKGKHDFKVNFAEDDLAKAYVEYMRREWTESKGEWEYKKKHGEWFYDVAHPVLSVDTSDWGDGDYQIKVTKITDAAGNTASSRTVKLIVDNTAPTTTIDIAEEGRSFAGAVNDNDTRDYVRINFYALDESNNAVRDENGNQISVLSEATWGLDGQSWTYRISDANLANFTVGANYRVVVRTFDQTGNTATTWKNFTFNFEEMSDTVVSPPAGPGTPTGSGSSDDEGGSERVEASNQAFPNPILAFGNQDVLDDQDETEADPVDDSEVEGEVAGEQDDNGTRLTDTAAFGSDSKLLGMAWYWWLAIVAALVGGWLLVAAAIRRGREEEA